MTTLRIQLASDLHLETLQRHYPGERLIQPAAGADVLVLAGDIANGTKAVELFADWPCPVLYCAGNHEFYGESWEQARVDLRRACEGTSVRMLDNDIVEIGTTRILGATLWTDFDLPGIPVARSRQIVERALADYRHIRTQQGLLTTKQILEDHQQSRAWLERQLARSHNGKTVVVSHHGPHPGSIHARFKDDPVNAGFVSDLTPLVEKADLWLHGHVHNSFDYHVGRCRIVANPRGYPYGGRPGCRAVDLTFENPDFQWACIVEI